MDYKNIKPELLECYATFRLVNGYKACPKCERDHRLATINMQKICWCGTVVGFTDVEKRHIVVTEILPRLKN